MNTTICKAINEGRLLGFLYKRVHRWVEPHTYGLQVSGKEALCAWQTAGGSGEGFRLFITVDMDSMVVGEPFDGSRDGYHRGDRRFQVIHAEL